MKGGRKLSCGIRTVRVPERRQAGIFAFMRAARPVSGRTARIRSPAMGGGAQIAPALDES
jgi:hypothetical protein